MAVVGGGTIVWLHSLPPPRLKYEEEQKRKEEAVLAFLPPCERSNHARETRMITPTKSKVHASITKSVSDFDIVGVQLHAPINDVIAAIQSNRTSQDRFRVHVKECGSNQIGLNKTQQEAHVGGTPDLSFKKRQCVSQIWTSADNVSIDVEFVEDVRIGSGCMVSYKISVSQGGASNDASIISYQGALIKKYGPHEFYRKAQHEKSVWGRHASWGNHKEANLRHTILGENFYLQLMDDTFRKEREGEIWRAARDVKPVTVPKI